ncbi:hypothetical protein [Streptomyces olivaceoviridis]
MMTTTRLRAALVALGVALLAVGAVPAAEAAPAHPASCTRSSTWAELHTTTTVRLRAGRSTRTRSRTLLPKGTDIYADCFGVTRDDVWWAHGEVVSGPHKGLHGWIRADCLANGYRRLRRRVGLTSDAGPGRPPAASCMVSRCATRGEGDR